MRVKKKYFNLFGLTGLFGLLGFKYFATGNPGDLVWFFFFASLSSFILGNINREYPDERWRTNRHRAANAALWPAIAALFLVAVVSASSFASQEAAIVIAAAGWVGSLLSYAIAFRKYERE